MKLSLNWIKEFTDVQSPIEQLVDKIGAQLGAVDEVINLGEKYKGIVIVKVVSVAKHPDADRLSVCLVDDGGAVTNVERDSQGLVRVVCGAPNVKEGMLVAWLPPGVTVPSTSDKDPFVLEARDFRGVTSHGMLASAKELAIGDGHEGLLEIDAPAAPGTPFTEAYKLNDYIIDIENKMFTHRPDLFGELGLAREIAGIEQHPFTSPAWYRPDIEIPSAASEGLELVVKNEAVDLVPRFVAVALDNVKIGPSPVALQTYLSRLGIRPINNVVDVTNYVMLLTAQPLHAYDYDKVKSLGGEASLIARMSRAGEELTLLGGKTIKLTEGTVVIAAGERAIGLGGVMGGADTEVDETTQRIILECATFDMNATRRTAMQYGLFTDAATRFTKGQSYYQNLPALACAIGRLEEVAGAKVASRLFDEKSSKVSGAAVMVATSTDFINSRLGLSLDAEQISKLLSSVEFKVETNGPDLTVTIPFWRTDIAIAEDIVEEVGRLYGYDHLPLALPKRSVAPARIDQNLAFKSEVRSILSRGGANEVLTYSFVKADLLANAGQSPDQAFHIKNALSPALQYYRISLTPSLLEKVHPNVKNGFEKFALFEMGKGHIKKEAKSGELPNEMNLLALVTADTTKLASGGAYYQARRYLDFLATNNLRTGLVYEPLTEELDFAIAKPYEPKRSALVKTRDGNMLGIIGEFKTSVIRSLKLPSKSAGFEIDMSVLSEARGMPRYYPLNKYPETSQDITLRLPANTNYAQAEKVLLEELDATRRDGGYIHWLKPMGIFQRAEDQEHKQITWRITLAHPEKTLTTEEVNKIFDMLVGSAKSKLNAERV